MTAIAQVRLHAVAALAEGVVATVRALADQWAKARACSRTYEELASLSDRELDDLGLARWEIADAARRSVYGA